jgi:hypothetical protein
MRVKALTLVILGAALIVVPLSSATGTPSAKIYADSGTAESLSPSTVVTKTDDGVSLTIQRTSATSPNAYDWQVSLSPTESLTMLSDGSVAVVAPWPADVTGPDDGTDYMSPESAGDSTEFRDMPPLPLTDPYTSSADPDGSMAADEALHDVGPFDPAYPDEYLPDFGSDDPTDPDSPANANSGPPPGPDTTDTTDPSDDEPVPETDRLDTIYEVEASRSDQIIALISRPQGMDALGQPVPASLHVIAADTVELVFEPAARPTFPLSVTSNVTFNPDADTTTIDLTPTEASALPRCTNVGRSLVYTERGNKSLVNWLARRPGSHICHYIAVEPAAGPRGDWRYWPPSRVTFVHSRNRVGVTRAGSKFVAVARIDWSKIGGGNAYEAGKDIRRRMYESGFRPGSPHEDTWVINEIPSDIFTSTARRNRLVAFVHGLYFGNRGFRRTPGFVFKVFAQHDSAARFGGFPSYKSKWQSLLVRTAFWTPDDPDHPTSQSIAPYVRWWAEETFSFCWLLCVPGARFDGATQPPGNTKVHKTNEYLQHPARLAFARATGPSPAPPPPEVEARRLFAHGYMSVVNSFWTDAAHDGIWQTAYLKTKTMMRFSSLQIYAARRWAEGHPYPGRRISLAWSERGKSANLRYALAARLATSIAGGYSTGRTALDVCPGRNKRRCNPSMDADEQYAYRNHGAPHFIWDWQTYFSSW